MNNTYLRGLLLRFLDISGINILCQRINRNKALIIWYHGICDEDFDLLKNYDERHIPKSLFTKQLEYLKAHGFTFVSMTDLKNAITNKTKIDKFVVLTFDDGFKNVVENAYPIMKQYGAKGCFYLVSDLIGTNELLWTDYVETVIRNHGDFQFVFKGEIIDYKMDHKGSYEHAMKDIKAKLRTLPDDQRLEHMRQFRSRRIKDVPKEFEMATWGQINELDPNIMEIGSHTRKHPNCNNLTSDEELEDEIYNSKTYIENIIGHEVEHFCFPAGSFNEKVISKVQKYGYTSALTTENGFTDKHSNLYRLKRIEATGQFLHFKANVSGSNSILRRIKGLNKYLLCKLDIFNGHHRNN